MKTKNLLYLAIAGLIFTSSCKKDDDKDTPKNYTHVGVWNGKYGSGSNEPKTNYGMVFFDGGNMHAYDGLAGSGSMATGTYSTYATDSIKGVYQYSGGNTFYFRGKLNTERSRIDGRWGADSLATSGGTFYLAK